MTSRYTPVAHFVQLLTLDGPSQTVHNGLQLAHLFRVELAYVPVGHEVGSKHSVPTRYLPVLHDLHESGSVLSHARQSEEQVEQVLS